MFEVTLSPEAEAFYADADKPLARKLARCFRQLEMDPHHHNNIKSMKGRWKGYHRYRVGDWRIMYRIDEANSQVFVLVIAHRREVYD